ncbi:MAG: hypothetical protein LBI04_10080 [Treponema sp.]|jgi:hypothetical protein|nr:hypothetical protein [Treponema sp.]
MNIKNEESFSEQYTIISYSHADTEAVKSELEAFDKNGICYWFDERMTGGKGYDTQFFEILDNKNCKGIVFFVSDAFLLSEPCAGEMKHFKEEHGIANPDKFCLFVLPNGYPYDDKAAIESSVVKYVENNPGMLKKLMQAGQNIDLFLELNLGGMSIHATRGNNYIGIYCEEGQLFYNAGIFYGYKQIGNEIFGYFPQNPRRPSASDIKLDIEKESKPRKADKEPAYYASIEWLVIKDNEQTQTLLSKELLFAVDYLSLKHPFQPTGKTVEDEIRDYFWEYFRPDENDKRTIKKVRFLSKDELNVLLMRNQRDLKKKYEVLSPKPTFFAQISNRKNITAFWLAGDINDARRVDAATESMSEEKAGVELYYVRIVVEVEKPVVAENC